MGEWNMAKENNILTADQEKQLRQPIEDYVGKIQAKLDSLREDGTNRVVELQNDIDSVKRDHIFTQQEKDKEITRLKAELEQAKAVEDKNKGEVSKLIADGENYLKANFDKYYQAVIASCKETCRSGEIQSQSGGAGKRASGLRLQAHQPGGDQGREVRP